MRPLLFMARLSSHGGFDPAALEKAKQAMSESLEFAEQQEAPARNGAGYPSLGGFIEQHFNLKKSELGESVDFTQCQRSDGTIYGSRGECKQGKEVKKQQGNTGGARAAGTNAVDKGIMGSAGSFKHLNASLKKTDIEGATNITRAIGEKIARRVAQPG